MDQTSESTLRRRAGSDGLAPAIAGHVRGQADAAEAALGGDAARHVESLRTFAQYVEARPQDDLRIVALYALNGSVGAGGVEYAVGPSQAELFGRLGVDGPAPLPSATLDELVAVAVEDALAHAGQRGEQASREAAASQAEAQTAREAADAATGAIRERDALTVEVAELRAEVASKDGQISHLQTMIAAPSEKPSGPRRRKRLPGHEGIYFTDRPTGRVYEITWQEDGRRRWRTVGDDLDEAIAARAELAQEPEGAAA